MIRQAALFVVLASVLASEASAEIDYSGDVTPADPNTWTSSDDVRVGGTSVGELTVDGGDLLRSRMLYVGDEIGSSGTVTLRGTGTSWMITNTIICYDGTATLEIDDGASVWATSAMIGGGLRSDMGGSGSVSVVGDGSLLSLTNEMAMGVFLPGTMHIDDGGMVTVGTVLTIDLDEDGDSYITMANGGMLGLGGQVADSLASFLDLVEGTGDIRYWDSSISDWAHISGAAPGEDYTLTYYPNGSGDLSGHTVLTVTTAPEPATILVMMAAGLPALLKRRRG